MILQRIRRFSLVHRETEVDVVFRRLGRRRDVSVDGPATWCRSAFLSCAATRGRFAGLAKNRTYALSAMEQ
jgi:hypothetical protein